MRDLSGVGVVEVYSIVGLVTVLQLVPEKKNIRMERDQLEQSYKAMC